MLIWVIGETGILAFWFCKILKEKKLPFFSTNQTQVNLLDPVSIRKCLDEKNPTRIINCSAYTDVAGAEIHSDLAFALNEIAIGNLVKQTTAKIIHFSTDYVFDGKKNSPYTEKDIANPINVYGKSKRYGEKKLFSLTDNFLCIRISSLFGKEKDFVSKMQSLFLSKDTLSVVCDQYSSPTFAKDVVLMTLKMLDETGLFHFSSSNHCSWYEYSLVLFDYFKKKKKLKCQEILPVKMEYFSSNVKRPLYSVLSLRKIQTFRIKPRAWQDALMEYLDGS